MDDFSFDVMQKKRIAKNAIHRKGGSKSKKCSLPSDGMSQKEWEERNGEVVTIKMNQPMSWAEFKSMPLDLQQEYLIFLVKNFDVTASRLGEMFGVSKTTVKNWISYHQLNVTLSRLTKHTNRQTRKWEMFIAGEDWTTVTDSTEVMSWEGFKMLPREEQQTYLQTLIDTYDATQARIAEAMGVRGNTLASHCKKFQINVRWCKKNWREIPVNETPPNLDVVENPRPITWGEFKALPKEAQEAYLQKLVDIYGGNTRNIGAMFGISSGGVSSHVKYKNLNVTFGTKCKRASEEDKKRWADFIAGWEIDIPEEKPEEKIDEPDTEQIVLDVEPVTESNGETVDEPIPENNEEKEVKPTMDISFTMKGEIDVNTFMSMVSKLLGEDVVRGSLTFCFSKEGET